MRGEVAAGLAASAVFDPAGRDERTDGAFNGGPAGLDRSQEERDAPSGVVAHEPEKRCVYSLIYSIIYRLMRGGEEAVEKLREDGNEESHQRWLSEFCGILCVLSNLGLIGEWDKFRRAEILAEMAEQEASND